MQKKINYRKLIAHYTRQFSRTNYNYQLNYHLGMYYDIYKRIENFLKF